MDPVANMKEQVECARHIVDTEPEGYSRSGFLEGSMRRLAELVLELHEWQRHGGYSPYMDADFDNPMRQK